MSDGGLLLKERLTFLKCACKGPSHEIGANYSKKIVAQSPSKPQTCRKKQQILEKDTFIFWDSFLWKAQRETSTNKSSRKSTVFKQT